jgi:pyruvate,water dikinase
VQSSPGVQQAPASFPEEDEAPGDDAWPPFDGEALPIDLWTQMDLGERWPEPLTPLTWSTGAAMTEQSMNEQLAGIRAEFAGRLRWIKRAYGRAYLNEGGMLHVYVDGIGMPGPMIAASMTGVGDFTPQQMGWQWGKVLRHAGFFTRSMTAWERAVRRYEKDFAQIDGWVDAFMARSLGDEARLPDAALWREYEEVWWPRVTHYLRAHTYATSLSITAFGQVEGLAGRWLGDAALARDLAGGISGVIAAEIVPGLQQMAATLRRLGLAEAVRDLAPESAYTALRGNPAARPFLDELGAFLQRHGHRCMSEAEFLHPRWIEAPAQVLAALQPYLDMTKVETGAGDEGAIARRAAAQEQVQALPAPKRAYFEWAIRRLHRLARARDNGQHYLVKLMLPVRRIFAVLGERWARRGWLAAPEEFFFLVLPEIEQVVAAGNPGGRDLAAVAARRRLARDYWLRHPAPDALDAQGKPVALAAQAEASDAGEVLIGLAASAGQATGRARVVLSPADAGALEWGDILVTRSTDPGWTPVFSRISGVVLEVGGLLSHGAIVAREYGLPAVVNLPRVTERIPDGATLTVDGSVGRVLIHK